MKLYIIKSTCITYFISRFMVGLLFGWIVPDMELDVSAADMSVGSAFDSENEGKGAVAEPEVVNWNAMDLKRVQTINERSRIIPPLLNHERAQVFLDEMAVKQRV